MTTKQFLAVGTLLTGFVATISWSAPAAAVTATAPASEPAATSPAPGFTDIIHIVLPDNFDDSEISFSNGKFDGPFPHKGGNTPAEKAASEKRSKDHKIEGCVYTTEPDFGVGIITGDNTAFLDVDNTKWETMTPAELQQALLTPEAKRGGGTQSDTKKPVTFVFRTLYGATGIGQIIGHETGNKSWATLSFKLLPAKP